MFAVVLVHDALIAEALGLLLAALLVGTDGRVVVGTDGVTLGLRSLGCSGRCLLCRASSVAVLLAGVGCCQTYVQAHCHCTDSQHQSTLLFTLIVSSIYSQGVLGKLP